MTASACAAGVDELSQIETLVVATMQVEAELTGTVSEQVQLTVTALAEQATLAALQNTPDPSPTTTPLPTEVLTPTPAVVRIGVSANTNCRTGPATAYERQGALLVGETTEVIAKSNFDNYWYVANPDRPGAYCWLWGEYATLVGDSAVLPVYTPLPSPTPGPIFTLRLEDFVTCGEIHAVFKVHNTGPYTFMTADRQVIDLDTSEDLHASELDRHPFAPGPSDCPPGHDNELVPDQVAYIYIPMESAPSGHSARATIRICTEDYLGGVCFAQRVDFTVP